MSTCDGSSYAGTNTTVTTHARCPRHCKNRVGGLSHLSCPGLLFGMGFMSSSAVTRLPAPSPPSHLRHANRIVLTAVAARTARFGRLSCSESLVRALCENVFAGRGRTSQRTQGMGQVCKSSRAHAAAAERVTCYEYPEYPDRREGRLRFDCEASNALGLAPAHRLCLGKPQATDLHSKSNQFSSCVDELLNRQSRSISSERRSRPTLGRSGA